MERASPEKKTKINGAIKAANYQVTSLFELSLQAVLENLSGNPIIYVVLHIST